MTLSGLEPLVISRAGRVILRHRRLEDAPDEYRWRKEPELARLDGTKPTTLSYAEYLEELRRDLRVVDATRCMMAIDTHSGRHIGTTIFYNGDHAASQVEIGMSIGEPDFQGGGYGREAAIALLRHLFHERPFATVYMHAFEWNLRAIRCFAALGFEEVARLERNGEVFVRMETQRNWWLFWDDQGRFERYLHRPEPGVPHERS